MLESRSKTQKTQAYFPIKTSAKYFGLVVGP